MGKKLHVLIVCQTVSPVIHAVTRAGHIIAGIAQSAPKNGSADPALRAYARKNSIPYMVLDGKTMVSFARWVADTRADIGVVHSMSQLLKPDVLAVPRYGFINLHPSLLPAWRGADPLFWQYYHGDSRTGYTWHAIDAGEDTGAILAQAETKLPPAAGYRAIARAQANEGADRLAAVLESIATGNMLGQPQPAASTTPRAPRPDIAAMREKNLFDFSNWPRARAEAFLKAIEDKHYIFGKAALLFGCAWRAGLSSPTLCKRAIICADGTVPLHLTFSPRYAWRMLKK